MLLKELYEKICAGEDVRANLIELKRQLKEDKKKAEFCDICGDNYDVIMKCLADTDPKVRKNAADILGIMKVPEAVDVLMDAYREEETLYVRPDYVNALSVLDCGEYLEEFWAKLNELQRYEVPETEKKHVRAEITALRELLLAKGELKKHTFTGYNRTNSVILTTLSAFREILSAQLPFHKKTVREGIWVSVGDMRLVTACRFWREMLFVLNCPCALSSDPDEIASCLAQSDLMDVLRENHRGSGPFYFRVGVAGTLIREESSLPLKRISEAIERTFGNELINSVSHYEAEIRLTGGRDGKITLYLKLFTIPDERFRYRRYHVAAGMRPFVAAGLIGLAKPYLRESAQVLDPFCGVGTLLIERRYAGPVRSAYGIDTFGEAIDKARRNAQIAGMPINYINRNFFDFTHDYLFDEIITDMPAVIGDREETDAFYRDFFEKAEELLAPKGRIFCYTKESGLIKKHLRLTGRYRLLKEFKILEKSGTNLFILERKD